MIMLSISWGEGEWGRVEVSAEARAGIRVYYYLGLRILLAHIKMYTVLKHLVIRSIPARFRYPLPRKTTLLRWGNRPL